ncbi:hypothetical protein [Paracoccus lichenicola]|uniref:hypothetical protein n=1 Tax=Paracoccus lichenicola TaxID=2665644 RepID=UPI002E242E84
MNGALNLLQGTVAADIRNLVFSSMCATYGDQDGVILDEATLRRPINAFGRSEALLLDGNRL